MTLYFRRCRAIALLFIPGALSIAGCEAENAQILQIRSGDVAGLSRALTSGIDPNTKSRSGWPLIVEAAYAGRADMVAVLLRHGADANGVNGNGFTALSEAARDGKTELVRALLARGAKTEQVDNIMGYTPLHWAAMGGHPNVVEVLIRSGAAKEPTNKVGDTPLTAAIFAESLETVAVLLQAGVDPMRGASAPNGSQRFPPLVSAAQIDNDSVATAIVRLLLHAGTPVDHYGLHGTTALIAAAQNDNPSCAEVLLAAGADPNAVGGFYNLTALMWAASTGNRELAAALIRKGAVPDIELTNGNEASATSIAFERNDAAMLDLLLSAGGQPNRLARYSQTTLLQNARKNGQDAIARVLTEHGAR